MKLSNLRRCFFLNRLKRHAKKGNPDFKLEKKMLSGSLVDS